MKAVSCRQGSPRPSRLSFANDYWDGPDRDSNVYLDRLDVRNSSGPPRREPRAGGSEPRAGDCNHPRGDHFALYCNGVGGCSRSEFPPRGTTRSRSSRGPTRPGTSFPALSRGRGVRTGPGDGSRCHPGQARRAVRQAARRPGDALLAGRGRRVPAVRRRMEANASAAGRLARALDIANWFWPQRYLLPRRNPR